MDLVCHPVFPSLIVEIKLPLFDDIKEDLKNFFLNYQKENPSVQNSNVGGYQSDDTFWKNTLFKEYHDYFDLNIKMAISSVFNINLTLNNAWFNINLRGDYNTLHNHPGSTISGVIWVNAPEDSGMLRFGNHSSIVANTNVYFNLDKTILNDYNMGKCYEFKPKSGTLILFPSYMHHDVTPSMCDEHRISLAFNYS